MWEIASSWIALEMVVVMTALEIGYLVPLWLDELAISQ